MSPSNIIRWTYNIKQIKLDDCESPVDVRVYQKIIGSLTYATTATRPDISAAVGVLSKYMSRPGKEHMESMKRIICFLKGTVNFGLVQQKIETVFYVGILMPIAQGM